jgi:hypothetical protein
LEDQGLQNFMANVKVVEGANAVVAWTVNVWQWISSYGWNRYKDQVDGRGRLKPLLSPDSGRIMLDSFPGGT